MDEMHAKFVIDSHFKSQPKGANLDDKSMNNSQEDIDVSIMMIDPEILPQDMLKKYITFAKLHVFPKLHDAGLEKFTQVYDKLISESLVCFVIKKSVYYLRPYNPIEDE
ncbi:unnamed protein product [Lactuca saligna]|uniref:Uncharacterized protein n=1 Tax=Lactuca saligna TaxID=75948 RepID=A0AA35YVG2_LACSI|nr:unnamed protein product [Lactuca saligna]